MYFYTYITWELCIWQFCWPLTLSWNPFPIGLSGTLLLGFPSTFLILHNFLSYLVSSELLFPQSSVPVLMWVILSLLMSLTATYMLMASESTSPFQNTLLNTRSLYKAICSISFGWPTNIHGRLVYCLPPPHKPYHQSILLFFH